MTELLTIREASQWASKHIKRNITPSNIAYLINYGKLKKYLTNGITVINKFDLSAYYKNFYGKREIAWKEQLGSDLNWALSFDYLKEKDTTKHVHRLHPYKGKYIPQLVEYFLDTHTDSFKKESFFKSGDIILDPFCGSGTTMVQANELGIHAIGIDISAFNSLMANIKLYQVDFVDLQNEIEKITQLLNDFVIHSNNLTFEKELLEELNIFNKKHFPSPEFKIKVRNKELNEQMYTKEKANIFLKKYETLCQKYNIDPTEKTTDSFFEKWYLLPIKKEIRFISSYLKQVKNPITKRILTIVLSRTIRSCRATTHADLATLKKPIRQTYYCRKHGKICKPLFSILSWWKRYTKDTSQRLREFEKLKTSTFQTCLQGDSRNIDIISVMQKKNKPFANLTEKQKIKGIFSSPPYVGLIDYHEQHAYAYDLFGFERNDNLEIGPLYKGQGREARDSYIEGIAQVLNNSKRFLQAGYDAFLVANDKYCMYPIIAEKSGMQIVNQYKRPVLNRTEKDKSVYAEIIFHLKEQ